MAVWFDISSSAPVSHVKVSLSDGESWGWTYDAGTDGRGIRSFAPKPVTDGSFTFAVEATDAAGCSAHAAGPGPIIVVSK